MIVCRRSPNLPSTLELEHDEPTENHSLLQPADDDALEQSPEKSRRRVLPGLIVVGFFIIAFVVLPLLKVTFFGGSNFYSRFGRWGALRISIQSVDPGRIAVDDRDAEIKILTNFLYPFDTATSRASAYYDTWRADSEWSIRGAELKGVEFSEDRQSALATTFVHMQNVFDVREFNFITQWRKHDSIWYVETEEEILLNEYTHSPQELYVPEEFRTSPAEQPSE